MACCCAAGAAPARCSSTGPARATTGSSPQVDGMEYDSLFVFEELGWNFEPSELGAAFGLEQLKKLPNNYAVRQRNFAALPGVLRRLPGPVRPAGATRRPGHGVVGLPVRGAPRQRTGALGVPGRAGAPGRRHPHGVDRQRDPPADDARGVVPDRPRWLPERRPGDGARAPAALQPLDVRRRCDVRVRRRRPVAAGGGRRDVGRSRSSRGRARAARVPPSRYGWPPRAHDVAVVARDAAGLAETAARVRRAGRRCLELVVRPVGSVRWP